MATARMELGVDVRVLRILHMPSEAAVGAVTSDCRARIQEGAR